MTHSPSTTSSNASVYRCALALVIGCGVCACDRAADESSVPVDQPTAIHAFTNVNVVSMTSNRVDNGQTVIVSAGRITGIEPSASVAIPPAAQIIDGSGKYLAPGLADMHAHPMTTADLDAYLASGVTLIRAMWGEPAVLDLREGVASGDVAGPRIFTGANRYDISIPDPNGEILECRRIL